VLTTAQLGAPLDIQLDALQPAAQLPAEEDRTGSAGWVPLRSGLLRSIRRARPELTSTRRQPPYPVFLAAQENDPRERYTYTREKQFKNCEIHTVVLRATTSHKSEKKDLAKKFV